ncbi:MAG: lyase family protein [Pseudomonadota bacterium]
MLDVECGLATVQAKAGLIPTAAAKAIADATTDFHLPSEALAEGVASSGVPVPALVSAFRRRVGPEGADWVHYGATSQDIVDTAMMLCAKRAFWEIAAALGACIDRLREESDRHAATPYVARTRSQMATPITMGLRYARWAQPLIALENDAGGLSSDVFRVQLGGASGNLAVMGAAGPDVVAGLADKLGLAPSPAWHTDRSGVIKLAQWLDRLIAALAKLGGDMLISARSEIQEIRSGAGGGSSTMPHKSNLVTAEALGSVELVAHALFSGLVASAVHAEERDGSNWPVEWLLLPQLFELTGAALGHAKGLLETTLVDKEAVARRIAAAPAVMAEAAMFQLLGRLGREGATAEVKAALQEPIPLAEALLARGYDDIDWKAALDPAISLDASKTAAAAIFSTRTNRLAGVKSLPPEAPDADR